MMLVVLALVILPLLLLVVSLRMHHGAMLRLHAHSDTLNVFLLSKEWESVYPMLWRSLLHVAVAKTVTSDMRGAHDCVGHKRFFVA
jgi:hypothetical protein